MTKVKVFKRGTSVKYAPKMRITKIGSIIWDLLPRNRWIFRIKSMIW